MSKKRDVASTWSLPYRAPEMWLCESANFPVDLWAYGCMLEELARRRVSFPGQSDYDVAINIVKRLGAPPATARADNTLALLY